jgi:hypothetical protein
MTEPTLAPNVHKAEPQQLVFSHSTCLHCERPIKKVPGGQGPTWVHEDSGFVAEVGAPRVVRPERWWRDHDNLVLLTAWLAENGRSGGEVAYAVEKPWKYEDEFDEAAKEQEAS